jgi:WG containing repeat
MMIDMRRIVLIGLCLAAALCLSIPITDACSISFLLWSLKSKSAEPLFRFEQGGKAGYIDATGNIVVKPAAAFYDSQNFYGEFHEGITALYDDGQFRYMDRSGKILFKADGLGLDFSEGLAAASRRRGGDWGFLDRTGKFVIEPRFYAASSFSEGLAVASATPSPRTTGFIDHTGTFVILPTLSYASDFHEGLAAVIIDGPCHIFNGGSCGGAEYRPTQPNATYDCRYAFIDKTGKPISDLRFEAAADFAEGLAPVKIGGHWGYVNQSGRMVIDPKFEWAGQFSEGLAGIFDGKSYGFINRAGKLVIQPRFQSVSAFSDQRALVVEVSETRRPTYRFIDHSGKPAFPGNFVLATSFIHGLAAVSSDYRKGRGTVSWIDPSGKAVFTYKHWTR